MVGSDKTMELLRPLNYIIGHITIKLIIDNIILIKHGRGYTKDTIHHCILYATIWIELEISGNNKMSRLLDNFKHKKMVTNR